MKAGAPMTKIEIIEGSLRCFAYGLIGLLPGIGIPMAVLSAFQYSRVRRGQGEMWNPAHRYLFWGGVCARMSLALFLLVPAVVAAIAALL
jgi:hypothetical protein